MRRECKLENPSEESFSPVCWSGIRSVGCDGEKLLQDFDVINFTSLLRIV